MNRIFSLLFCLCLAFTVAAKNYTATVVDKAGKTPLAYANVGIVAHNIGTVTGEDGIFALEVPDSLSPGSIVRISLIGYEPYRTSLRELENLKTIPLNRSDNALKEVVVQSKVFNRKILGNTTKSKSVQVGFTKDSTAEQQLGYELGTLMKIKKQPTLIDSVFINFSACTDDSLFFRLNIYEIVKDSFINILPRPYYLSFSKAEALNGIQLNLRELDLVVAHNFLVSLELIREMKDHSRLFFSGSFLSSKTYFRSTSQADWLKLPMNIGIGISAKVRY